MDILQFSKCLRELVEENDRVEVPHLGVFTAENVPASFSDRRTTINPPSRTMSFQKEDIQPSTDNIFINKMMQMYSIPPQQVSTELGWCLSRIISELEGARVCNLPGLGKLKANARREFFFIPDADLDIYPDGLGLEPVSIRFEDEEAAEQAGQDDVQPHHNEDQPLPESKLPEPVQQSKISENKIPNTVQQNKAKSAKGHKAAIALLVCLAAVIITAIILFLMKDNPAISSFLDKILYTEEELQIIGR